MKSFKKVLFFTGKLMVVLIASILVSVLVLLLTGQEILAAFITGMVTVLSSEYLLLSEKD